MEIGGICCNLFDLVCALYRGSYMSARVLLNLLNKLGKRDKMRGLPSILSLFRNEFNKFNNTRARMLLHSQMRRHIIKKNSIHSCTHSILKESSNAYSKQFTTKA